MNETRRDFLKKSGGCALGMVSLATQMHHLGTMNALAQTMLDQSASPDAGYKALVLLFFSGGNDGNNMVVPIHDDPTISNYTAYANERNASGLALPRTGTGALLPIPVPRLRDSQNNPLMYGLHPSLGPVSQVNNGIHELWGMGKLAIVTNVGTLVQPLTKAQYSSSAFKKPYQLFSHSDQVSQAQTAISSAQAFTGWGGRISDKMTAAENASGLVPMVTSISGAQLYTSGQTTLPLSIADSNTPLANVLAPVGFTTPSTAAGAARMTAFNALRQQDLTSHTIAAASHVTDLAIQANNALQTPQEVTVTFPNTSIGRQLKQVARMIKKRTDLSVGRQIFFVQIGGFDTHTSELPGHQNLYSQFGQAMRAFYDETVAQGVSNDVTLFTLSDFCRTFNPAGSGATVGTDHAWGNHMFVMGGSVVGGDFYGSKRPDGTGNYYPTLLKGNTVGAFDDADNNSSGRGRWIPTTSVEMYAVRLARWFGLKSTDEAAVFPNLVNFATHDLQNSALNFMG